MAIYKLKNYIQNYEWGSVTSMRDLFGFSNDRGEPQAELWMGAHPNGSSSLVSMNKSLADYIAQDAEIAIGSYSKQRYGQLPFLFKVLAAQAPLSIQVHPNKESAEKGFKRENSQGIPLEAYNRSYKDANHKPELVYALTPYKAMNGFRPICEIISLFDEMQIDSLFAELVALKEAPNSLGLKQFFGALMSLNSERKFAALYEMRRTYSRSGLSENAEKAMQYSRGFAEFYDDDIGLLAPLFLNIVELEPGEAMFLNAETLHSYVYGTALEIMASSDNVLRAGLTSKYINVQELIDNTIFEPVKVEDIKLTSLYKEGKLTFSVPVDDFSFDILIVESKIKQQFVRSAEILFCIEGDVQLESAGVRYKLEAGDSVFIPYNSSYYQYNGIGRLARAYN